jgi:EF hand
MKRFQLSGRIAQHLALAGLVMVTSAQAQTAVAPQLDARFRLAMEAAFSRADTDHDGRLSRQEAEHFPAIAARFDALDVNRDNQLSMSEFEAGYTASS